VLTAFGAIAVTFMMVMYALEHRGRRFILAFAAGCVASSAYGFLAGTWPFGVVEALWAVIAIRRYLSGSERRNVSADTYAVSNRPDRLASGEGPPREAGK
jgi:hypothetical protein